MPVRIISALGCASLAAVVYAITAGPTFYWLDSSEFVAAAWSLGNAHPPGHPLAALLGRLASYIPFGTISFRVGLGCALHAATAVGCVFLISREMIRRAAGPATNESTQRFASAVAALTAAFSYALWFQAVRAEVYALNTALILGTLYALLRWDATEDRRYLIGAACVVGIALCNHHLLVIIGAAGALPFLLWRRPNERWTRLVMQVTTAVFVGLLAFVYLPIRAHRSPLVNWGNPTTSERTAWVVSAKAFQKTVKRVTAEPLSRRVTGAFYALMTSMGPLGVIAAFGGLYLLWRRRALRRIALLLTGQVTANLASPIFVGFDPFNPDAHGYLSVAVCVLATSIALLVYFLSDRLRRHKQRVLAAVVVLAAFALPATLAAGHYRSCDLSNHWDAEETSWQTYRLPPHSILITSYFETVFQHWAMSTTQDARPDVYSLHRNFLNQPGYAEGMRTRAGPMKPFLEPWARRGDVGVDALGKLARHNPVFCQFDINTPPELANHLEPFGLVPRFRQRVQSTSDSDLAQYTQRFIDWHRSLTANTRQTTRAMTWIHFILAQLACANNDQQVTQLHLNAAHALAPKSADVAKLAQNCSVQLR